MRFYLFVFYFILDVPAEVEDVDKDDAELLMLVEADAVSQAGELATVSHCSNFVGSFFIRVTMKPQRVDGQSLKLLASKTSPLTSSYLELYSGLPRVSTKIRTKRLR